jgi:hypothetical protein
MALANSQRTKPPGGVFRMARSGCFRRALYGYMELARGSRDGSSIGSESGSLTKKTSSTPIEGLIKVFPKLELPSKQLSRIRFFHLLFVFENDSTNKKKSFLSQTLSKLIMHLNEHRHSASRNPLRHPSNISSHFEPIHCHTLPLKLGCCFSPFFQHPIESFGSSSHLALNLFSLRD